MEVYQFACHSHVLTGIDIPRNEGPAIGRVIRGRGMMRAPTSREELTRDRAKEAILLLCCLTE